MSTATGSGPDSTAGPRRIALVLSLPYPSAPGGAERWTAEVANALRDHATVTEHYIDPERILRPRADVNLHGCLRPPIAERDRLAFSGGLIRAAMQADIVHVCQYGTVTAQLLALVSRLRRKPVFVTDHGSGGLTLARRVGLERAFTGYLCVSQFAAEGAPADRIRIVYGGVAPDRFSPGARSPEPFALFVGRLLPHKGIDWLIQSLPPGRRLVIAGRPDDTAAPGYLGHLRELARDAPVQFRIDPGDRELLQLYQSASVTVLPSVWTDLDGRTRRLPELLGLTLLESMACATPVIASRLGPLPEVVDLSCGALVEPGDQPALGAALEQLLGDPGQVARLGEAARSRVLERFTWPAVAQRILSAYRELGRHSPSRWRMP